MKSAIFGVALASLFAAASASAQSTFRADSIHAGAYLLLKTPAHTFMRVLPWLTLGATLLFAFGKKLAGGRASFIGHESTGFALAGAVYWRHGAVMIVGAIAGGFLGAHYAMKMPQAWIRYFVVLVGAGMTVYFFCKSY